jgi:xylulokinase
MFFSLDFGSTSVKGVLVDQQGKIVSRGTVDVATHKGEQHPQDWIAAFRTLANMIQGRPVDGVICASQMQDLILVDKTGRAVMDAILYHDTRAEDQARRLESFGDASSPAAKMLWVKENKPEIWKTTDKVLFGAKDYVLLALTGKVVCDTTTACTTSLYDTSSRTWRKDLFFPSRILPALRAPGEVIATVTNGSFGVPLGVPVYAGIGDCGATTYAAGLVEEGDVNINLGTTGWVATITHEVHPSDGVFHLVDASGSAFIRVVPFFNAANVYAKALELTRMDYAEAEQLLQRNQPACAKGVFAVPYLNGERFPVCDPDIRASVVGLDGEATGAIVALAFLEGVAFSLRMAMEHLALHPSYVSVIGGGARSDAWCQVVANALGVPVHRFPESQYEAARALVSLVQRFDERPEPSDASGYQVFLPDPGATEQYRSCYPLFTQLCAMLKDFAHNQRQCRILGA